MNTFPEKDRDRWLAARTLHWRRIKAVGIFAAVLATVAAWVGFGISADAHGSYCYASAYGSYPPDNQVTAGNSYIFGLCESVPAGTYSQQSGWHNVYQAAGGGATWYYVQHNEDEYVHGQLNGPNCSSAPSGQLSADAKFSGGRFKVNATVRHTGLTVASSEVVMLLSASDGEIRRVSQPAGREVTDGQAFDVSFEEVTGEPPKAAYLIYEWSGGSSQPQPIWPHRSVSLLHRLAPPGAAAWTYILAFAVLWVLIPTITRFFRYQVPSRSPNRPSVRMKAIGLASLVVLAAVSAAGFLWLSNPADSLEEVETGSLPRFAEGEPESFARLVTDAVESHEGSAASWKVTQIMPLTSRGETIGCAAFFTVQGDAAANATDERTTERTMLLAVTRTGQLLFYGEA